MKPNEEYPRGPNGLAALCADKIEELTALRDTLPRSERKPVNQHLHTVRQMLRWCKTRAGYEPTLKDLGLD